MDEITAGILQKIKKTITDTKNPSHYTYGHLLNRLDAVKASVPMDDRIAVDDIISLDLLLLESWFAFCRTEKGRKETSKHLSKINEKIESAYKFIDSFYGKDIPQEYIDRYDNILDEYGKIKNS